jgi:hypothetical protein
VTSAKFRADIYDPKTLAAMDQAFVPIWHILKANDPSRDSADDAELRIAIGKKLLNLVSDGVTDPLQLRNLTVQSLILQRPDRATPCCAPKERSMNTRRFK